MTYLASMDTRNWCESDYRDPDFSVSEVAEKLLGASVEVDDMQYEFESITDCRISNTLLDEAKQEIKEIVVELTAKALKANFSQSQIRI